VPNLIRRERPTRAKRPIAATGRKITTTSCEWKAGRYCIVLAVASGGSCATPWTVGVGAGVKPDLNTGSKYFGRRMFKRSVAIGPLPGVVTTLISQGGRAASLF
jgi:hypothetical protein